LFCGAKMALFGKFHQSIDKKILHDEDFRNEAETSIYKIVSVQRKTSPIFGELNLPLSRQHLTRRPPG
jgi:hypothetical protein